jgi:hypothetical protein
MLMQCLVWSIQDEFFVICDNALFKWKVKLNLFHFVECFLCSLFMSIEHVQCFFLSLSTSFVKISMLFETLSNKSKGFK